MYEYAENRSIKSLFAVRFSVGRFWKIPYIAWIYKHIAEIAEICGKLKNIISQEGLNYIKYIC